MTTPKYKHFKFEDRYVIQEFLRLNYSFTAIANRLKKDRHAVSKEILKHRFLKVGANKRKLDCNKPDKPPYVYNGCLNKNILQTKPIHIRGFYRSERIRKDFKTGTQQTSGI